MKKIIFTICLMSFLLTPMSAFAQKLPFNFLDKHPEYEKYQVAITEEPIGKLDLPGVDPNASLYRETVCEIDQVTWDEKTKTGTVMCTVDPYLQFDCTDKPWPRDSKTGAVKIGKSDQRVICDEVGVIVGKGGLEMIKNFISVIYLWGAGLVGIIAVLRIVIAGVEISTSQGAGRLEEGKNKIFQSLASLILLFLSAMILYTINPNFFV